MFLSFIMIIQNSVYTEHVFLWNAGFLSSGSVHLHYNGINSTMAEKMTYIYHKSLWNNICLTDATC